MFNGKRALNPKPKLQTLKNLNRITNESQLIMADYNAIEDHFEVWSLDRLVTSNN